MSDSGEDNNTDIRFFEPFGDPARLPPAKLAFIGDAVYELMAREFLTDRMKIPFDRLNDCKRELVCAQAQARAAEAILPMLSEEEAAVYRHGRNAKHKYIPKNATHGEYGKATGFETLFGYLYLSSQKERLKQLFLEINKDREIQFYDKAR